MWFVVDVGLFIVCLLIVWVYMVWCNVGDDCVEYWVRCYVLVLFVVCFVFGFGVMGCV